MSSWRMIAYQITVASWLFGQPFVQLQIKENIKDLRHWLMTSGFPSQRASNAENISIWWHHVYTAVQIARMCGTKSIRHRFYKKVLHIKSKSNQYWTESLSDIMLHCVLMILGILIWNNLQICRPFISVDVIWYQYETNNLHLNKQTCSTLDIFFGYFPYYWPFVQGIHWSRINSPHKGQ